MLNSANRDRRLVSPAKALTFKAKQYAEAVFVSAELHNSIDSTVNSVVQAGTSDDGSTWTNVGAALTIVPGGVVEFSGTFGRYGRFVATGAEVRIAVSQAPLDFETYPAL